MALESDGSFTELGRGHVLAVEVAGPTLEACLARAVEGFADAVADVHPSVTTSSCDLVLDGATPSALLLAVLEECMRRGREGQVAVALHGATLGIDGALRASLHTVPVDDAHVAAQLPHVLSWHEVSLEPGGDGWRGRIVAR